MKTIELSSGNNASIIQNDNGLSTFKLIGGSGAVFQLVRLRLIYGKRDIEYEPESAIPWIDLMSDKRLVNVLPTFIRNNISETEGVTSVDLSNVEYELNPVSFKGICFSSSDENTEISI